MKIEIISLANEENKESLEKAVMDKILTGYDSYIEKKKLAEQRKLDRMIAKLKSEKKD